MENSLKRNSSIRKRIGEKLNNYNSLTSNLLRPVQFARRIEIDNKIYNYFNYHFPRKSELQITRVIS